MQKKKKITLFHCKARDKAEKDSMGRWTRVRDAVPGEARRQLQVQVYNSRARRHFVVACTQLLAQSNCLWCIDHIPQRQQLLPL
jgi:hypothetical protein